MPLFNLSDEQLENEIIARLTELAERKHAGDVDRVRIQMCYAGGVVEVLDFRPGSDPSGGSVSPPSVRSGASE